MSYGTDSNSTASSGGDHTRTDCPDLLRASGWTRRLAADARVDLSRWSWTGSCPPTDAEHNANAGR